MIVRVRRFGGGRVANPPAWGVLLKRDQVELFYGIEWVHRGMWWVDDALATAYTEVTDADVPDEVWAALAKWRLLDG